MNEWKRYYWVNLQNNELKKFMNEQLLARPHNHQLNYRLNENETGLQPVSRPVEQVLYLKGQGAQWLVFPKFMQTLKN